MTQGRKHQKFHHGCPRRIQISSPAENVPSLHGPHLLIARICLQVLGMHICLEEQGLRKNTSCNQVLQMCHFASAVELGAKGVLLHYMP